MRNKLVIPAFALALLVPLAIPLAPARADLLADNIVSDADMENAGSMSLAQIQDFLMRKGTLASYFAADTDGTVRTAAEIIWRVANTYSISPKFLLALIQREQSLVEDPDPTQKQYDWATGFGVCDSCSMSDPDVVVWKGFGKQVESAAKQIRDHYLPEIASSGVTVSGIGPGVGKTIDGTTVIPANAATAVLYTYTPHLTGNLNFANIWKRWFGLSFPDGTLAKVKGSTDIWLINGGEKHKFASLAVFRSRFDDSDVVTVQQSDLDSYPDGTPISFPNFSIVQGPDGSTYLLDGDSKRLIASTEVFRKLGFNPMELQDATADELAQYSDGPEITLDSSYPTGALLQDKGTGGVYWVEDGVKYPIWDKSILKDRFSGKTITPTDAAQLADLQTGDPVRFSDGTLIGVKGESTVYVIEHGDRRPIANEETFERLGWNWANVIWTDMRVASLQPLGEPVDIGESAAPSEVAEAPTDSSSTATTTIAALE